jgi:hypothetical protein
VRPIWDLSQTLPQVAGLAGRVRFSDGVFGLRPALAVSR